MCRTTPLAYRWWIATHLALSRQVIGMGAFSLSIKDTGAEPDVLEDVQGRAEVPLSSIGSSVSVSFAMSSTMGTSLLSAGPRLLVLPASAILNTWIYSYLDVQTSGYEYFF